MKIIEKSGEIYWGEEGKPGPLAPASLQLRGTPEVFRDNGPAVISSSGASFWFVSGREKAYRAERMDLRCRAVLYPNLDIIISPVEPISPEVI